MTPRYRDCLDGYWNCWRKQGFSYTSQYNQRSGQVRGQLATRQASSSGRRDHPSRLLVEDFLNDGPCETTRASATPSFATSAPCTLVLRAPRSHPAIYPLRRPHVSIPLTELGIWSRLRHARPGCGPRADLILEARPRPSRESEDHVRPPFT